MADKEIQSILHEVGIIIYLTPNKINSTYCIYAQRKMKIYELFMATSTGVLPYSIIPL